MMPAANADIHCGVRAKDYFVYIMASRNRVLYIGVTNDLNRRVSEHRAGLGGWFSRTYRTHHLVYFETSSDPRAAIAREKQLKRWTRLRKQELIGRSNPEWRDLAAAAFVSERASSRDPSGPKGPSG